MFRFYIAPNRLNPSVCGTSSSDFLSLYTCGSHLALRRQRGFRRRRFSETRHQKTKTALSEIHQEWIYNIPLLCEWRPVRLYGERAVLLHHAWCRVGIGMLQAVVGGKALGRFIQSVRMSPQRGTHILPFKPKRKKRKNGGEKQQTTILVAWLFETRKATRAAVVCAQMSAPLASYAQVLLHCSKRLQFEVVGPNTECCFSKPHELVSARALRIQASSDCSAAARVKHG